MTWTIDQSANLVSVHANETIKVPNSHINFNNTSTINVTIGASGSNVNTCNVAFDVNTSAVVFIGPQGNTGAQGPQGDKGDTGDTGPQGPAGNTAPALPIYVMAHDSANIQYTDTYFTDPFLIPANSLQIGSTFRITLTADILYPYFPNLNIRFGPHGNTSDPSVYFTPITNPSFSGEYIATVRSLGPSANLLVNPLITSSLYVKEFPANTSTINTAIDNYFGVSYSFGYPGEGTNIFNTAIIQQIK